MVLPGFLLLPDCGFATVSRTALLGWCAAFVAFLVYATFDNDGFLFRDNANLMIHEAGHVLFGWAGCYTQILGGTLAQVAVPLVCTLFFLRRGETTAVAATMFWMFENLLYVAFYMADARRSALPLVGSDESDWTILFSHWGVLQYDPDDRSLDAWRWLDRHDRRDRLAGVDARTERRAPLGLTSPVSARIDHSPMRLLRMLGVIPKDFAFRLPIAFTEQGVAMLSSVLRSPRAIAVNIEIMRAFVQLRRMLDSNAELSRKLQELERKYDGQFAVVFDAIRKLMAPPPRPGRRIGFRENG